MKAIASTTLAFCALLGSAFAQLPGQPTPDSAKRENGVVRDGFTISESGVMVTRNGKTERVVQEFVLTNGTHLYPNGDIVFYTGGRKHLELNQLLTLDGVVQDTPVTAGGVAPVYPAGTSKSDVGVSSKDGITVSGADTLITRNGVTEKVTRNLELSNGLLIKPDGTFSRDGKILTLRENQVLGFDGVLRDAPIHTSSVAPVTGAQ